MSIVVSADIGEFGPIEGKAVAYRFPFYGHFQSMLPYLFLAGLFALKENRKVQILWLFVPWGLLWVLFVSIKHLMGFPSSADVELNMMFTGLVGGFITIFLLAERLRNRSLVWVFLIPLFFIGIIYFSGTITNDTIDMAVVLVVSILSLWGALALTKMNCSKRFCITRFLVWQGIYLFLFLLLLFMAVLYIWSLNKGYPSERMVPDTLIGAAICTAIYFMGLLPFEILLFVNSFWRKRFEAVFGLKTKSVAIESVEVEQEPLDAGSSPV